MIFVLAYNSKYFIRKIVPPNLKNGVHAKYSRDKIHAFWEIVHQTMALIWHKRMAQKCQEVSLLSLLCFFYLSVKLGFIFLEENILTVFENQVLSRIFRSNKDKFNRRIRNCNTRSIPCTVLWILLMLCEWDKINFHIVLRRGMRIVCWSR